MQCESYRALSGHLMFQNWCISTASISKRKNILQLLVSHVWKFSLCLGTSVFRTNWPFGACCVLWDDEMESRLSDVISPVLLNVKSSCYFTVIIFFAFLAVKLLSFERLLYVSCIVQFFHQFMNISLHVLHKTQLLY